MDNLEFNKLILEEYKKSILSEEEKDAKELIGINRAALVKIPHYQQSNYPEADVKSYNKILNQAAANGVDDVTPFNKHTINFIQKLPEQFIPLNYRKPFIKWLANCFEKGQILSYNDIAIVKDWVFATVADGNVPELTSFEETLENARNVGDDFYSKEEQQLAKSGYKTNNIVMKFEDGYRIVEISANKIKDPELIIQDLLVEGTALGICVGRQDLGHPQAVIDGKELIFSIRDPQNRPHVTISVIDFDRFKNSASGKSVFEIDEIKGKQNSQPVEKYLKYVFEFIIKTDYKINSESDLKDILLNYIAESEERQQFVLNNEKLKEIVLPTFLKKLLLEIENTVKLFETEQNIDNLSKNIKQFMKFTVDMTYNYIPSVYIDKIFYLQNISTEYDKEQIFEKFKIYLANILLSTNETSIRDFSRNTKSYLINQPTISGKHINDIFESFNTWGTVDFISLKSILDPLIARFKKEPENFKKLFPSVRSKYEICISTMDLLDKALNKNSSSLLYDNFTPTVGYFPRDFIKYYFHYIPQLSKYPEEQQSIKDIFPNMSYVQVYTLNGNIFDYIEKNKDFFDFIFSGNDKIKTINQEFNNAFSLGIKIKNENIKNIDELLKHNTNIKILQKFIELVSPNWLSKEIIQEIYTYYGYPIEKMNKILKLDSVKKETLSQLIKERLLLEDAKDEVKKAIESVKSVKIDSITTSPISEFGLIIRFEDKEAMESGISKVKSAVKKKGYSLTDDLKKKYDASTEVTDCEKNGELVRLIYKYDDGRRDGIVLEHILSYALTGLIDDRLKSRIGLEFEASEQEVIATIQKDYAFMLKASMKIKDYLNKKYGKIVKSVNTGSTSNKADLMLTLANGKVIAISLKYQSGEDVNDHTMNKVLGDGSEPDSLIYNAKGAIPWWLVFRRNFAKKLGKQFIGSPKELEAPDWMIKAKESEDEIYKDVASDLYEQIRNVFVTNINKLSPEELSSFVSDSTFGVEDEVEQYDTLLKILVKSDKITIENISSKNKINSAALNNQKNYATLDGSRIHIQVPGAEEIVIDGLKFKDGDPLKAFKGSLKIKTR